MQPRRDMVILMFGGVALLTTASSLTLLLLLASGTLVVGRELWHSNGNVAYKARHCAGVPVSWGAGHATEFVCVGVPVGEWRCSLNGKPMKCR